MVRPHNNRGHMHRIERARDEHGCFLPSRLRYSCDQCEMLRICGVVTHESGCPEAWRDAKYACHNCGCDFEPQERYQRYCSPCCAAIAFGETCECVDCVQLDAYARGLLDAREAGAS